MADTAYEKQREREREGEGERRGSHEGLKEIIACGDGITVATEQRA